MAFNPVALNLPSYPFKIKEDEKDTYIFDEIRKRYLVLTPEEWVRQHVVQYLILNKYYPKSLIKLEGGLKYNSLQKRSDILLFNNEGHKIMLVECKAPSVKITQSTFDQIARYNFIHRVKLLLVSNGLTHYCCEIDQEAKSYRFLQETPDYKSV